MGGADAFGNDLREYQDEQGHCGADDAEPVVSSRKGGGLVTHRRRTQGIGDGIKGKNGPQGAFRFLLEF